MSHRLLRQLPVPISALVLAAAAHAQTGPWTDGELLLRSEIAPTGERAIFRIVPETGATAVLTTVQYWAGFSGALVFDPYRDAVLSNMSMAPDGTFFYRLWLVAHDGSSVAMPGFTGNLKALATAGDGRVFFIRHTGATQGPTTIEYFDASDAIQTLKQSDGVTPFQADVEHLLYDAASNALIGSSSAQWAATHCGPIGSSLYRFPLSADGLRVIGPGTCISVPTSLLEGDIMALDHLPGGNVLVTTATGFLGAPHRMMTLNPVTLAVGSWAEPLQGDINGGIWSPRLGRAVIHADSGSAWWEPSGLRLFNAGNSSFGAHVATSLPLPYGGGFSPSEILAEVDLNGPACDGCMAQYGAGLAGKGGIVPSLSGAGCSDVGASFSLHVDDALGSTLGVLALATGSTSVPLFGGTLLVLPIVATQSFATSGAAGQAGAGSALFPFLLNDPSLSGTAVWAQAALLDANAVQGIALTNGLKVVFG